MKRLTGALAWAMMLTGCATYSLVEPPRAMIGDLYTVDPQIPWSAAKTGKVELWTVDGPALQAIRFISGIGDGEALLEGREKEKQPQFRKSMTASEIMEFVADTLSTRGLEKVEVTRLRPEKFGTAQGFRFEMNFVTGQGLEGQGSVVGAVVKERLQLIMYSGLRAHYYPKYKDHVERIIESIRMQ